MTAQRPVHPIRPEDETLTCEVIAERGRTRVLPQGSLDLASAPLLDAQLEDLRAGGARMLVLDLRELAFMDSTGLRLALRWQEMAERDGFSLGFVAGPPHIQRVFELTGTTGRLAFVEA